MRLAYRGVLCALFFACSSDSDVSVPPAPPEAGATTSRDVTTFAVDSIELGDSVDGVPSETAWQLFGFDLDGKTTTASSTDVCTPTAFASQSNQVDGKNGRDDGFGKVITPILETVIQPICFFNCQPAGLVLSVEASKEIAQGQFTLQLRVIGLGSATSQTATGLSAQIFTSDSFDPDGGRAPSFSTSSDWPVQAESVNDGNDAASGAKATFSAAYVVGGTFVAGTNETVAVPFHARLFGIPFTLVIHSAIITFARVGEEARDGVIAGVVDPDELVAIFRRVSGVISRSLCGAAFDGIEEQLRAASDILLDRTNVAGTPCTGISVGLRFHARQIGDVVRVSPPLVTPDPCADAGGDSD